MLTTPNPQAPQGAIPLIGIPDSRDIPRLVYTAPYFVQSPLAELIEPAVQEAVEAMLPALVPPYVDGAASAAVQELAVLLTGSSMSGPLMLSPLMPTADTMAATKAYVDTMIATAGVPEVPAVPVGQTWAREVGQWVPIAEETGVFLPIAGGTMQGQINMSGNAITNLPAVPVMPNGAAPAQWVLQQISSVSLYQGVWNLDTMVPDLTAPSTHVNGYTWIAVTTTAGVVVGPAVPGLQGKTVFNGDHVIFSAAQGTFSAMHSGGLTLPEADARYLALAGGQMSGALLLNANATAPTQAVTKQQLDAAVLTAGLPEAPTDGQVYGRNGVTHAWAPALPLVGGVLSGPLTLSGNATLALQAVPKQQLDANLATAVSGYLPIAGGVAMTGLFSLSGNAGAALNPVPLQQVTAMLNTFAPLASPVLTGDPQAPTPATADNDTSVATTAFVKAQGYATSATMTAADNLRVLKAGDTMTGGLAIDSTSGTSRTLRGTTSGSQRWDINLGDYAAESSGNVGTNFSIQRYSDAGGDLGIALSINRATGNATFSGAVSALNYYIGAQATTDAGTVGFGNTNGPAATFYGSASGLFGDLHLRTGTQVKINDNAAAAKFAFLTNTGAAYKPGGGTWADISDERTKMNVSEYTHGLPEILQLNPIQYEKNGRGGTSIDGRTYVGLIANQAKEVMPEMVGVVTEKLDDDDKEPTEILTLEATALLYALVNSVKALSAKVQSLEGATARRTTK